MCADRTKTIHEKFHRILKKQILPRKSKSLAMLACHGGAPSGPTDRQHSLIQFLRLASRSAQPLARISGSSTKRSSFGFNVRPHAVVCCYWFLSAVLLSEFDSTDFHKAKKLRTKVDCIKVDCIFLASIVVFKSIRQASPLQTKFVYLPLEVGGLSNNSWVDVRIIDRHPNSLAGLSYSLISERSLCMHASHLQPPPPKFLCSPSEVDSMGNPSRTIL